MHVSVSGYICIALIECAFSVLAYSDNCDAYTCLYVDQKQVFANVLHKQVPWK